MDPNVPIDLASIGRRAAGIIVFAAVAILFGMVVAIVIPLAAGDPQSALWAVLLPLLFGVALLVWSLAAMAQGQTPAHQLVGIHCVTAEGRRAAFWRMLIVRGFLPGLFSAVSLGIFGLLDYLWALWDKDRQTLHDKVAGTFVVRPRQP